MTALSRTRLSGAAGLLALAGLALGLYELAFRPQASVEVAWTTVSELDTAGFNLHRGQNPSGPFSQVNEGLIPASADPLLGGRYVFTDSAIFAGRTYYYVLEEVDLRDSTARHGPIAVAAHGRAGPRGSAALVWLAALVLAARAARARWSPARDRL